MKKPIAKTAKIAKNVLTGTPKQIAKKIKSFNIMNLKVMPKDGKGFDFLVSLNRSIRPSQVTTISKSINLMGVLRPIIVAKFTYLDKEGMYIIDGQHLYHALLRNNMDFPYIEIEVTSDKDLVEKIALLNSSSKSWTLLNYIQAWSYTNVDYKILMRHFNTYDLEIQQVASILHNLTLSGLSAGGGSRISKVIKTGQFNVLDEQKAITIFDYITDVLKIIPRMDRMSNKLFVSAYVDLINSTMCYEKHHAKFCEALKKHVKELKWVTADKDTVADFLKRIILN